MVSTTSNAELKDKGALQGVSLYDGTKQAERKTFTSVFRDLANTCTVHGVQKIQSARHLPLKILWSMLLLATFGLLSYQLLGLFKEYYSYHIKTTVSLEFSPLSFPAISFCNMNPIRRSVLWNASADVRNIILFKSDGKTATGAPAPPPPQPSRRRRSKDTYNKETYDEDKYSDYEKDGTGDSKNYDTDDYEYWNYKNWQDVDKKDDYENVTGNFNWNSWASWSTGGNKSGSSTHKVLVDFWDDLTAEKDVWQERIESFQTVFRNEPVDTRRALGHAVADMVQTATFATRLQNSSDFELFTTIDYGNCYTMTSPKYIAWNSGPAHGIQLTLNLEITEYVKNFATGYGVRLVFHEPGTYPFPSEEGITISPGHETSIGLRMVSVTRLPEPYGTCTNGDKFYKRYKIKYSRAACMQFCFIRYTMELCGCTPASTPDIEFGIQTGRICNSSNFDDKMCAHTVTMDFEIGKVTCADCKAPCNEVIFDKTVSGRRWPNTEYLQNVLMPSVCERKRNHTSMKDICETLTLRKDAFDDDSANGYLYNFLRIVVYYEDLNYEVISQEPMYETTRFLADIGGALGLFMGASLVSAVELFQLIFELVCFLYEKYRIKRRTADDVRLMSLQKPQEKNVQSERKTDSPQSKDMFDLNKKYSLSIMPNYISTKA